MTGRQARAILALVAVAGALSAREIRGEQLSLAEELVAVYVERCEKEVKVLAQRLDVHHDEVVAELPRDAGVSVLPAVRAAWERGSEAIDLFRQLEGSPRKFTRWARESALPPWFSVPESVTQIRRWEAMRPILAPIAGGDRLDWHQPDVQKWTRHHGSWAYEHLLLLRWLGRDSPELPASLRAKARAWVAEQTGTEWIERWRRVSGDKKAFFHDQYVYTLLGDSPPVDDLSPRLQGVIRHLTAASAETPLVSVLRQKDAFLIDLLTELVGGGNPAAANPAAVAWFDAGARAFPPLTVFKAEADGHGVRALLARQDPTLEQLLERLDRDRSGVEPVLSRAILRSQVRLVSGGKLDAPVAGWSTWTPSPTSAQPAERPAGPSATLSPSTALGPANAWSRICAWALNRLAAKGIDQPLHVTVENPSGWTLAFRSEELVAVAKELKNPLRFASGSSPGAVEVILATPRVEPQRGITVELRVAHRNVEAEDTARFEVPGAWPPWFACRRGLDPWNVWTWTALLVWGILALEIIRRRTLPLRSQAAALQGLGLASTLLILLLGPVPVPSPELGGILEFSLPLHEATPPSLRDVIRPIARRVYDEIGALLSDESERDRTPDWWQRWRHAAQLALPFVHTDATAAGVPRLAEVQYRIRRAAWPHPVAVRQGRVRAADGERFDQMLASLAWEGEPAAPPALAGGPDPSVRLVISMWDGDHGALLPATGPIPPEMDPPVLSIVLPSPTRDGRSARGLDLGSRYHWIRERSTRTLTLLEGHPGALDGALPHSEIDADASAGAPTDLEALRQQFWEPAAQVSARVETAAEEVARHAVELFTRRGEPGARSSRSVLRLPESWLRSLVLWLVLLIALPFWLTSPGLVPHALLRLAGVGLLGLAIRTGLLLAGLAAFDATLVPWVWSYGGTSTAGMVTAFRILSLMLIAAGGLRLAAWVQEAWFPDAFTRWVSDRRPEVTARQAVPSWRQGMALAAFATAVMLWAAAPVGDVGGRAWLPDGYGAVTMAGLLAWSLGTAALFHPSNHRSPSHGSVSQQSRRKSSF